MKGLKIRSVATRCLASRKPVDTEMIKTTTFEITTGFIDNFTVSAMKLVFRLNMLNVIPRRFD